jgi:hypothetical protein
MPSESYGIRYLFERLIPLKQEGRNVCIDLVMTFSPSLLITEVPDISKDEKHKSLRDISRKELIKMIVRLFLKNGISVEDLKVKVMNIFAKHNLETANVKREFDEFIERRRLAKKNYDLVIEKRRKKTDASSAIGSNPKYFVGIDLVFETKNFV